MSISPAESEPITMQIVRARYVDAEAISDLIRGLAYSFIMHPADSRAGEFLKAIEPEAIRTYLTSENIQYFAGVVDTQIAGVVALRDGSHLFHLFVAQSYQGQGLARKLWEHAKQVARSVPNTSRITVNSSLSAVPMYERFGFIKTGCKVEANGIAFVPMAIRF